MSKSKEVQISTLAYSMGEQSFALTGEDAES